MTTPRSPKTLPARRTAAPAYRVRPMRIEDYDAVLALWRRTEGVAVDETDSLEATAAFLRRNPRMSQVACAPERRAGEGERIVGAVLAGSDGRRGMLYHLAVSKRHRGHGLGRLLADAAMARLRAGGCLRVYIAVLKDNAGGRAFWKATGWQNLNRHVEFMGMWME